MAHIESTANGVLMVAFGFLVPYLRLNNAMLVVWFVTLQIGTWTNGVAGVAGAFSGGSSPLMPALDVKFPPPGGIDSATVTSLLQLCGVTIILALVRAGRPDPLPAAIEIGRGLVR